MASAGIWFIVLTPIAVLLFFQTGLFIRHLTHPDGATLLKSMADDRLEQVLRRKQYLSNPKATPLPKGLDYDPLFTSGEKGMLETEAKRITTNSTLETEFNNKFGVSLKDLDAVVFPAAKLSKVNCPRLGVESQALEDAKVKSAWRFSVGGFTIRDGAGAAKATADGRPRIAIHPWSFATQKTLRRALLHEMFHSANIPAFNPFPYSLAHHDLTYLPEYKELLGLANLNDDCFDNIRQLSDDCLDNVIWFFLLTVLGLIVRCLWIAYDVKSSRRLRLNPVMS
ncbi:MAG: hypothetical protein WCD76_06400 [Pyrinomonadaceae bacterium]